jgi:hypothetical protein
MSASPRRVGLVAADPAWPLRTLFTSEGARRGRRRDTDCMAVDDDGWPEGLHEQVRANVARLRRITRDRHERLNRAAPATDSRRVTLGPRESAGVFPFYLTEMRTNGCRVSDEVWQDLVTVGRRATLDDVLWLLGSGAGRPVVMGAWFGLRFRGDEVGAAILDALRESNDSFTAPPLVVAAVTIVGSDAAAACKRSRERSDEASVPYLDAALEHLGAKPAHEVSERTRASFAQMLAFGQRLRVALTAT